MFSSLRMKGTMKSASILGLQVAAQLLSATNARI